MQHYGLIVIGAGPGGYKAAAYAAAQGEKVAIVERDLLGGTCLNRGCVPTKCLCGAADRIVELQSMAEFGIEASMTSADFAKVHQRASEVMATLRDDVEAHLNGVDIIHGEASLGDKLTVTVGDEIYSADKIIIATGSHPAPFPAVGGQYTENSDSFLARDTMPARLAIVGGGVIGLEFASIAAAYGTEVTVIEYCKEVLPGFDAQVAKRLRSYLSRRGIKFILGAKVIAVASDHTITYEAKNKEQSVEADAVLCAVGRRAVLPKGLADIGVETNVKGFVVVDENYETSVKGIYAIGDVNGTCMLAHAAYAQAARVTGVSATTGVIPSVVFTNPECASVGLCVDSDESLQAVSVPFGANAKALASGHTDGILKVVHRNGVIVGCQAVGAHAADLIAQAAVAIDAGLSLHTLSHESVYAHPSLSELLQTAAETAL